MVSLYSAGRIRDGAFAKPRPLSQFLLFNIFLYIYEYMLAETLNKPPRKLFPKINQ
jgi:hypothetical protein